MTKQGGKKQRRRRAPGRGALVAISALLIGSALIRIGDDAGQAFAKVANEPEVMQPEETVQQGQSETPEELQAMLNAFREREAKIAQQEAAIQDRMQALKFANREIERKLTELTAAEEALRETIALADTAAESDLDRLTRVYENMKPKQAAALFEEMDPNFAAGFLAGCVPKPRLPSWQVSAPRRRIRSAWSWQVETQTYRRNNPKNSRFFNTAMAG